ncbi:MAG: HDOD domain-containing protein [Gammaproteobacteria bacterium]|nr:HDOD domain-containing protein [Gammaproteobacteria bacterium]
MSTPAVAVTELSPALRIAHTLVTDMSAIVSPPEVCLKVNSLLANERSTMADLAAVIVRDPGLSARVLRLVNSPWYGLVARVDTISRAVVVLGVNELQKIVCAMSAVNTFSRLNGAVTNMNSFWRHGVYTGLVAQAIARRVGILHPERLFVAGVMHDIGTLIINHRYPEIAEETIRQAAGDEQRLAMIEMEELGFDHAQLGGLMLAHWQLPAAITDAIAWHHEPRTAHVAPIEATILNMADGLANDSGSGSFSELPSAGAGAEWDPLALTRLGLTLNFDLNTLQDDVDREYVETICLFLE